MVIEGGVIEGGEAAYSGERKGLEGAGGRMEGGTEEEGGRVRGGGGRRTWEEDGSLAEVFKCGRGEEGEGGGEEGRGRIRRLATQSPR